MIRRFEYPLFNRDPETFNRLVCIALQLGVTPRRIANQGGHMVSTVERWSRNETSPVPSTIPATALGILKILDS